MVIEILIRALFSLGFVFSTNLIRDFIRVGFGALPVVITGTGGHTEVIRLDRAEDRRRKLGSRGMVTFLQVRRTVLMRWRMAVRHTCACKGQRRSIAKLDPEVAESFGRCLCATCGKPLGVEGLRFFPVLQSMCEKL